MHLRIRVAILALVFSASLGGLSACGGEDSAAPTSGAGFNDADVSFAQGMVPHHNQAVDMAKLAPGRASSPQVKALAAQIVRAQRPEIVELKGFLAAWDRSLPPGMDTVAGMEAMGDMPEMAGMERLETMASGADIAKLKAAKGKAFDRLFLKLMLAHHRSAVAMAEAEQARGIAAEAKALAGRIVAAQRGEIARMNEQMKG